MAAQPWQLLITVLCLLLFIRIIIAIRRPVAQSKEAYPIKDGSFEGFLYPSSAQTGDGILYFACCALFGTHHHKGGRGVAHDGQGISDWQYGRRIDDHVIVGSL